MKHFKNIGVARPSRSVFDLSHDVKLTCDMGELIPVLCEEVVPGDTWEMSLDSVARMQPMVAPMMHDVALYTHTFYVPYRLLTDTPQDWQNFITGGEDGEDETVLPRWTPTATTVGSLWDYLGMPVGVNPTGATPLDFPRRAYNFVYNEYYRDQNLQTEVALTNENILQRNWEKDYFTSCLPFQQRGIAPALPVTITGTSEAIWSSGIFAQSSPAFNLGFNSTASNPIARINDPTALTNARNFFNGNTVDLGNATATTFNVSDLRLAFQIQKWMERNARAGARYKESLLGHFGYTVPDDRLQRPEYIGGTKSHIFVSEVLQTSETATSPQGNLAGHGLSADIGYVGKFTAPEHGLVMTILSVMPKPAYQQGINRQWLRSTRYDFYFPEFANLSEQAIIRAELYASGNSTENNTVFGFQGRYDEMRVKMSRVCGMMRDTLNYWHMGRIFTSAPVLNSEFVTCTPTKRVFAVTDEDCMIINIGHRIKAIRPLPYMSEPGLIDH